MDKLDFSLLSFPLMYSENTPGEETKNMSPKFNVFRIFNLFLEKI